MNLVRISTLLLVGMFVQYDVGIGCTYLIRGVVGEVVQVGDTLVFFMATTKVRVSIGGDKVMEGYEGVGQVNIGEIIRE